jgi:hypothetical protein
VKVIASPAHTGLLSATIETEAAITGLVETASVCAVPVPHPLIAVTLIVPPVLEDIAVIDVVVDAPLHPVGSVHE